MSIAARFVRCESTRHHRLRGLLCLLLVVLGVQQASAQLEFESAPINYQKAPTNDPIARLQKRMNSGEVTLKFDRHHGYLPAVLDALNIPVSSQMLVFSQTSFQLRRITPTRPRAVYFSDDMYIGWVQYGDVVEVSAVDPTTGSDLLRVGASGESQTESSFEIADNARRATHPLARKVCPGIWSARSFLMSVVARCLVRGPSLPTIAARSTSVGAVGM